MIRTFGIALRLTFASLVVTGILYPLLVTGAARVLFPRQADGGLVTDKSGRPVGSALIAQSFVEEDYLHPRPSAAGSGYDGTASSGSNLGPTSRKLRDRAAAEARRLLRENPEAIGPLPMELITASASGLDPHVSPEAALWQAPRIARARKVSLSRVVSLLHEHRKGRDLGVLGEPRVNVLAVNLALDERFGRPARLRDR